MQQKMMQSLQLTIRQGVLVRWESGCGCKHTATNPCNLQKPPAPNTTKTNKPQETHMHKQHSEHWKHRSKQASHSDTATPTATDTAIATATAEPQPQPQQEQQPEQQQQPHPQHHPLLNEMMTSATQWQMQRLICCVGCCGYQKRVNKHTSIAYANDMAAPSLSTFDVKPSPNHIYRFAIGDIDRAQHCSRDSNTLHMEYVLFSRSVYCTSC